MGKADRPGNGLGTSIQQSQKAWQVLAEVKEMLDKAVAKHAPMASPHEGHSVIEEEFEELWEHVKADTGRTPEAREEALQIACMAVRYIMDLCD